PCMKFCQGCGTPLPDNAHFARRFCNATCAMRAYRRAHNQPRYCLQCRKQLEKYKHKYCAKCALWKRDKPPQVDRFTREEKELLMLYFALKQKRKARRERILLLSLDGTHVCHWCVQIIDPEKIRHHPHQHYCNRGCALCASHEQRVISGFYFHLFRFGDAPQLAREKETGERPGADKRRAHIQALHEARRNGKAWRKTGPKKRNSNGDDH